MNQHPSGSGLLGVFTPFSLQPAPDDKEKPMLTMTVSEKHQVESDYIRCSNVKCKVVCEPPIAFIEFKIGCSKKVYDMPFCVRCMRKLDKAGDNAALRVE